MGQNQQLQIKTLTSDGAWCFFADPRAIYFEGKYKRTYIGWLTKTGDVVIGFYDHRAGQIESFVVKEGLQVDDHANPSLFISGEGYITIYYSAHGGDELFYRTSNQAETISDWCEERKLPLNTKGDFGYTYPNPIQLSDEANKIYLFWRGGNFKPTFATTDDGITWSHVQTLIEGSGARPYIKFTSNNRNRIYFAFTDGHPNKEPTNSIYCAYYDDGSIYKPNGEKIKDIDQLPVIPSEADVVYDANETGEKAWIWDIALNRNGNPVVVYAVFHSDKDHRYHYAHWTGSSWVNYEITAAGGWFPETPQGKEETEPYYSGGIILDPSNPANVYLSRKVNGIFEIEKWTTTDQGENWEKEAITKQSAINNVRPIVSRNSIGLSPQLFWMQGEYVHYTDYDTRIKYLLKNK